MNLFRKLARRCMGERPSRLHLGAMSVALPGVLFREIYRQEGTSSLSSPVFTLSFDLDLREDLDALPWLLDTLASYSFKAVFGCIGKWVELEPGLHRSIVDAGHEIVNHTYSHPNSEVFNPLRFADLSPSQQRGEVERGHAVICERLDYEPIGFRVPHLMVVSGLYSLLRDVGYRYSSSALARRRQVQPFLADAGVWELPLSQCPRHPSSAFDTYHAFRSTSWLYRLRPTSESTFFNTFCRLLDLTIEKETYLNVYFDPLDLRPLTGFRRLLDALVERKDRLLVSTYRDLLSHLESGGMEKGIGAEEARVRHS